MLVKSNADEIQSFLSDASFMPGGAAEGVMFVESVDDVSRILAQANQERTPVTISGAGTGTVGGRVAFGGVVLATEKLNRIKSIGRDSAVVEAGVVLADLQRSVNEVGLLYPPDPTERGCFIGGNVATNASGSRSFKYGSTRNFILGLKVVLANGRVLELRRGELRVEDGRIRIPSVNIDVALPTYEIPKTRKNATGYFVAPGMDVIDLFIGSEGTLGVVTEVEVKLLPKSQGLLSGVVFFGDEANVLSFVREARAKSFANRASGSVGMDARALEFFDSESLNFLRQKYPNVPETAVGAVFFEQETTSDSEDVLLAEWMELLENHSAFADSWFATNEQDQTKLREFRHQLPVLMNEWFSKYGQKKVSTDMAVPDEAFAGMLSTYQETLKSGGLRYTIFGHIGDNHVHVNILPRNDEEGVRAREFYVKFLEYAASVGGTLSAEHGVGKLKRGYLKYFYSESELRQMLTIKKAFDPHCILGRGNIFSEELLQ